MKVVVLAPGDGWHVDELRRAATTLGVELEWIDFRCLEARLDGGGRIGGRVGSREIDLRAVDCVIVRTMPAGSLQQIIFRMDVLHALAAAGVRVFNPPAALETAIDKYLSLVRLSAAGLPVPATWVSEAAPDPAAVAGHLGTDVVAKPLFGSGGNGLERLQTSGALGDHSRRAPETGEVVYLQRFVPNAGSDLRLLVLGGEVVACMRRRATSGWITSIARGGTAGAERATPEAAELACRAARAVGAELAGVDVLPDRDGKLWVLEVNAVPGWRALQEACGVDVAARILEYLTAAG